MNGNENLEYIKSCREKLVALGFVLQQNEGLWATDNSGMYLIDFSEVNPEYYIHYALATVYNRGITKGEENIKSSMKSLLGLE